MQGQTLMDFRVGRDMATDVFFTQSSTATKRRPVFF